MFTKNKKYYQIKYTYKHYDEKRGLPRYEYELYYIPIPLFPHIKKFISINYHPIKDVPIIKEVIM